MSMKRWRDRGVLVAISVGLLLTPWPASGQGGETAGVITEIKVGKGKIEVKPAGAMAWRPAGPLLALRAGDTLRATDDASAVVLLSGGRGTVRIDASSSPFVMPKPHADESKVQKARTLLASSLNFLSSGQKELPQAVLSTRAAARPPQILSPRNGPVLPGPLAFEWLGSRFSRYTVKIVGPSGVVLERKGVTGGRFEYPSDAPPLTPGVRYNFQVLPEGQPPQEAWFELLDANRAQAIRTSVKELEQAFGNIVPPNTLVALRVGFLASEGLIHDARRALTPALAKEPDEPTFHVLLGNLYARAGLPELAAEAYDEAHFLTTLGSESPAKR